MGTRDRKVNDLAKVAVGRGGRLQKDGYEKGLRRLQTHLVRLQEWVRNEGLKVVVLFEGRDAAGKGGVIKRITESLSVLVLPASLPLAHPLNARRHNGISNAMSPTCPLPEKLVSSTAVGTIVPAWNVLWDSAHPRRWKEFHRSCPEFRANARALKLGFGGWNTHMRRMTCFAIPISDKLPGMLSTQTTSAALVSTVSTLCCAFSPMRTFRHPN